VALASRLIVARGSWQDILHDEYDYEDYKRTYNKTELPPVPLPAERSHKDFLQMRIERELNVLQNPPSKREDRHPDPSFYDVRPYVKLALRDDYKLNRERTDAVEDCKSFLHVADHLLMPPGRGHKLQYSPISDSVPDEAENPTPFFIDPASSSSSIDQETTAPALAMDIQRFPEVLQQLSLSKEEQRDAFTAASEHLAQSKGQAAAANEADAAQAKRTDALISDSAIFSEPSDLSSSDVPPRGAKQSRHSVDSPPKILLAPSSASDPSAVSEQTKPPITSDGDLLPAISLKPSVRENEPKAAFRSTRGIKTHPFTRHGCASSVPGIDDLPSLGYSSGESSGDSSFPSSITFSPASMVLLKKKPSRLFDFTRIAGNPIEEDSPWPQLDEAEWPSLQASKEMRWKKGDKTKPTKKGDKKEKKKKKREAQG
jgi:hypothetical protein